MTDKPYYEHDCDACVFLGKFTFDAPHLEDDGVHARSYTKRMTVDLYCCPSEVLGPSIIARYQSEDSAYSSMPAKIIREHQVEMARCPSTYSPALLEGLKRAEKAEPTCTFDAAILKSEGDLW